MISRVLIIATLALALATPALSSDERRVEKFFGKLPRFVPGKIKPKVACICRDPGDQHERGILVLGVGDLILCVINLEFEANGEVMAGADICDDYVTFRP